MTRYLDIWCVLQVGDVYTRAGDGFHPHATLEAVYDVLCAPNISAAATTAANHSHNHSHSHSHGGQPAAASAVTHTAAARADVLSIAQEAAAPQAIAKFLPPTVQLALRITEFKVRCQLLINS